MIQRSKNPPAAAFFRHGMWYRCNPESEWECVTSSEVMEEIRLNEREAVKQGKTVGGLLRKLRGKVAQKSLAAKAKCSLDDLVAVESGRGLDMLAHVDALDMYYGATCVGPVALLSGGPHGRREWRREMAKLFRQGLGGRDAREVMALSGVSIGRMCSLERGEGLDAVRTARDVLQALSICWDVRPPDGFRSLAEYVWAESTY